MAKRHRNDPWPTMGPDSQAAWAMWVSDRVGGCTGDGCDLDDPCPRHARVPELARRYVRLLHFPRD